MKVKDFSNINNSLLFFAVTNCLVILIYLKLTIFQNYTVLLTKR